MSEVRVIQGLHRADSYIVIQNVLILLLRYVALWILGGVLVLFLPRYLGDQGLGQLQFALSFVSLFTIALALGVRHYLIKEVARNNSRVQTYLGSALGLRLVMAVIVLPAVIVVANLTGYSEQAKWTIYIAAIWMVVTSFAQLMASVLNGLENMTWPSLAETANKVAVVAIGIPLLIAGHGVLAYAGILVLGSVIQLIINGGYLAHKFPVKVDFNVARVKTLLMGGAPFLLMGFVLSVYQHIDVVMLRMLSDESVVGWYAAAMQIFRSVEFLSLVLTTALLPTMARVYLDGTDALTRMAKRSISVMGLFIVPLALGISLLAGEIIGFLPYPDIFKNSVPLLAVLALSIPVTALLTILGTISIAADRQQLWALALLGTLVINVGLNALAIPYFQETQGNGAIGAALATLASETAMVLIGIWLMPKGVIGKDVGMTFLKIGVSCGVAAIVVLLLNNLGLNKVVLLMAGGITYAVMVMATRAVLWSEVSFTWQVVNQRIKAGKTAAR